MSIATRIESIEEHIGNAYDELQGLGADLTNVNKNIENISMVLDDIYDSMPQVSGEGTNLTLDDTRVGKIKSTLKGNTSQTGTPTPTTPIPVNVVSGDNEIKVQGKNLAYTKNGTYTYGNNTGVITDNSIITLNTNGSTGSDSYFSFANGYTQKYAPSGSSILSINDMNLTTNGGTYTATVITNKTMSSSIAIYFWSSTGREFSKRIDGNTTTTLSISLNDNEHIKDFGIWCAGSNVFTNYTIKVQLEKGSSSSTYEPYTGNIYNIDLPVENKFDISTITENKYINTSGGLSDTSNSNTSDYIEVKANQTYTLSWDYTPPLNSTSQREIVLYNTSKTFVSTITLFSIDSATKNITFTPSQSGYIRFDYDKKCFDIQLEKGSKQNAFTPYGTTPIELCSSQDGTKRDYFLHDKTLDKWYWHREIGKVVLNGSETIDIYNQNTSRTNFQVANILSGVESYIYSGDIPKLLSNRFISNTQGATWVVGNMSRRNAVGVNEYLYLTYEPDTTIEAFKAWLGTNNVPVYYVYATPTNTEITYQPLIDQLNLLEQAQSKENQTNISQVNNDLPFIISASALKEWQESTSLNSTLSMVNPLRLGNTLNTQEIENNTQPIEVDNIEPLEEEEDE